MALHRRSRPIRIPPEGKRGRPRRCRGYHLSSRFVLSRRVQLALLDMPDARLHQEMRQRVLICQILIKLMAGGLSHNQACRCVGVPPATGCNWLKLFRERGPTGLKPKRRRAKGGSMPSLCKLQILIRP